MSDEQQACLPPAYSLWVCPEGETAELLQKEIITHAEKYSGPVFNPHVTVLPAFTGEEEEVKAKAAAVAAKLKRYYVTFLEVTIGDIYWQTVFLLCDKSQGVMEAGAVSREVFQIQTSPYMPHLSLLYSDMDQDGRRVAAGESTARLYGDKATYETLLKESGFWANTLQLWYTPDDKTAKSWRKVAEYKLAE